MRRVLGAVVIALPFVGWLVWGLIENPAAVGVALGIAVVVMGCTFTGLWLMERGR